MNEREAWLYLARLWSKPVRFLGVIGVETSNSHYTGICNCLEELLCIGSISPNTHRMMRDRLNRESRRDDGYLYPCTKAGAKKRAAFCRKQARLLKPRAKKKAS